MHNFYDDVRDCLLNDWDPIGVNDTPAACDEYDNYVSGLCDLLKRGTDANKLRNHLVRIETINMGLSEPSKRIDEVVGKLLAIANKNDMSSPQ